MAVVSWRVIKKLLIVFGILALASIPVFWVNRFAIIQFFFMKNHNINTESCLKQGSVTFGRGFKYAHCYYLPIDSSDGRTMYVLDTSDQIALDRNKRTAEWIRAVTAFETRPGSNLVAGRHKFTRKEIDVRRLTGHIYYVYYRYIETYDGNII